MFTAARHFRCSPNFELLHRLLDYDVAVGRVMRKSCAGPMVK
jgi:hypothetical protein